jgi:hypothetical protein
MDLPGTLLPRSDKTFRTVIRMKRIINNGYPLKDDRFVAFDANVAFLYGADATLAYKTAVSDELIDDEKRRLKEMMI